MRTVRIASITLPLGVQSACATPARPGDVVIYASGADLESANPLVTIHPLSRQIQRHVLLVTLVRYDSTLAIRPYFARRWTWSGDRRALTLTLHGALHWHDGVRTTAADAQFTLLRARDVRYGFARAGDLASVDTVAATSDTTLVVRFRTPQRDVPAILAELPLVPRHVLADVGPGDMRRAPFGTSPVGNGPFRFVGRRAGQYWEFERDSAFPSALGGPPDIRRLMIVVVDEPTTKFAGLASGELDFAGIAAPMADLARRDPMIEVIDYPVLFSTALVFNTHRAPFDDARVRRAVSLAVDRHRIVVAALAGFGTPAGGPVGPDNPLAWRGPPAFDTARADALLDSTGWVRSADGWRARGRPFDVELLTVGSGDNAVEQLVQADLAARGVRVRIRQLELGAFLVRARARVKDFDMLITGIPGDLSLAYLRAMYESSQSGGSLDYSDYHTPALDASFAAARDAGTSEALRVAWVGVQRELTRTQPAAWLYHARGLQGVSARMRNVTMDLRGELATVTRWTADTASRRGRVAARR